MNFHLILPEIVLLALTCAVMLVDLFIAERDKYTTYLLTQLTIITVFIFVIAQFSTSAAVSFNGLFVHDGLAGLLKLVILATSFAVFLLSRDYLAIRDTGRGEPYILGLFSILGMMILVSGHNLLTLYLGLELMSFPIYAIVALERTNQRSSEAGMKYFVLGAIASGLLLYGFSMLYGATGSLDISIIAERVATIDHLHTYILIFGMVFIVAGICFKIGVVPFHMWVPDVYTGSPNSATLFLSVAPKIAAFGLLSRLLVDALPALAGQWHELFIVVTVLSMLVGNIVAIAQTNIKRMLAYSTISHGGYILLGFAAATADGYSSALFYTIVYAMMTIGAFGLLTVMSREGFECDAISDLRGLNQRSPWLAFLMLIIMFSMAGIPPTVGFFAKLGLLEALIDAKLVWLAAFTLIIAVVASFYYLRVIKTIYFDTAVSARAPKIALDARVMLTVNGMAIVLLGLFPSQLIELCHAMF